MGENFRTPFTDGPSGLLGTDGRALKMMIIHFLHGISGLALLIFKISKLGFAFYNCLGYGAYALLRIACKNYVLIYSTTLYYWHLIYL